MKIFHNAAQTEKWVLAGVLMILLSSFLLLLVSVAGFGVGVANCVSTMKPFEKGEMIQHDPHHFEIHYVARMWAFEPAEVTVPPDAVVDIYLTSADVTHGFLIPGTNINMMAVPGAVNYARVKFPRSGSHDIICHEYCGSSHHQMAAKIHVGYANIGLAAPAAPAPQNLPAGRQVMQAKGCIACHSSEGSPGTGPTFKRLFGSKVPLEDGSTATADEDYLRESILQPGAKVVKGYANIMPTFTMTDAEIHDVTEYIKTLQ